eukprot:scaffold872_cov421-Prasinococcus_capsulatus_cf.AAC.11
MAPVEGEEDETATGAAMDQENWSPDHEYTITASTTRVSFRSPLANSNHAHTAAKGQPGVKSRLPTWLDQADKSLDQLVNLESSLLELGVEEKSILPARETRLSPAMASYCMADHGS